jgi:hypothetical protein
MRSGEGYRLAGHFRQASGLRRFLRSRFGILLRDEIKANYLLRGSGDLKRFGFGEQIRHDLYRMHLRVAAKLMVRAFAVVIDKPKIRSWRDPRNIAWEFTLQRLERVSTKSGEPVLIMHDEGRQPQPSRDRPKGSASEYSRKRDLDCARSSHPASTIDPRRRSCHGRAASRASSKWRIIAPTLRFAPCTHHRPADRASVHAKCGTSWVLRGFRKSTSS